MKCVLLDRASMDKDDLDFSVLENLVSELQSHDHVEDDELISAVGDADVIVTNKVVIDRRIVSACDKLKLICVAATGINNVDIQAAREFGIAVCNARAYATPSVVEHVFAMIMTLMRNLNNYQKASCDGRWSGSREFCYIDKPIIELSSKVLGIVGYGELGKAVARVAAAFGMEVIVAQRPGDEQCAEGRVMLTDLLPQVDVLSLHCPLDSNTSNLIDIDAMKLMKPESILINTARGGVVNEQDLLRALQEKLIAGAGLDVLLNEPPDRDYPLLRQTGLNLVLTPHIAWASREARQRLVDEIYNNIQAFMAGNVRNSVL